MANAIKQMPDYCRDLQTKGAAVPTLEIIHTGQELRAIQNNEVLGAYMLGFLELFTEQEAVAAGTDWWPLLLNAAAAGPGVHHYTVSKRYHRLINLRKGV